MTLIDRRQKQKPSRDLRQIGLLATVPMLLLAAPLVGYFAGQWADSHFGTEPYLSALGTILGLASAGIETYNLVKKASATEKDKDSERQSGT